MLTSKLIVCTHTLRQYDGVLRCDVGLTGKMGSMMPSHFACDGSMIDFYLRGREATYNTQYVCMVVDAQ